MKIQKSYYLDEGIVNKIINESKKEQRSESQMLEIILNKFFKKNKK